MFPPPPPSHLPPIHSTAATVDVDADAGAADAHQHRALFVPTRQGGRDAASESPPLSASTSASSSRSPTQSYRPVVVSSSTGSTSAPLVHGASPASASLTPSQAKSKSHASGTGHLNHHHPNMNANSNASTNWIHRPVARAPSAESLPLRYSPVATAAAAAAGSRMAASVQPETYQLSNLHFPQPPSPSSLASFHKQPPQNQLPTHSPTMGARVPTGMAPPHRRGTHPSPPLLRKQHSAYTLGGAEAGRGYAYHNYGALGTPPQELPPLQAQIATTNRKASTSISTTSTSTSAYTTSTPTSPTGTATSHTTTTTMSSYIAHTTSPISLSPPYSLLSAPTSPTEALPPLPSSPHASYHPPHAHGPRKAVSHNNMRHTRTRTRPATAEGLVGNRGIGTGVGVGPKERGGEWERRKGRDREDVTPWEFQSPSEPDGASAGTPTGVVAQSLRSRASTGVGATGPIPQVKPWEGHGFVGGELGGRKEQREGAKDKQEREKARDEETKVEEEDREYGVSRPMEFTSARAHGSYATSATSAGSIASSSTGSARGSALSVRSRASSAALGSMGATGPVEEVKPWEVQARDSATRNRSGSAIAPSVRSRASSIAVGATGLVEEVTPWEVQAPAHALSVRSRSSSAATKGTTGPVEEVTPWEVQTLAEESELERASAEYAATTSTSSSKPTTKSLNTNTKARKTKERSDSHSTTHSNPRSPTAPSMRTAPSVRSRASSGAIGIGGYAITGAGGSVATGPVEEVTPWEVQVPISGVRESDTDVHALAVDGDSSLLAPLPATPDAQSTRSDRMGMGDHGELIYGISREVPVTMAERERERERSRSMLSFHSGVGAGAYGAPPTSTTMTNGGVVHNSNSKPPSVRSGRSRASSAMQSPGGVGTTSTGSVEEVTPWEMYPAPPVLHAPPPPLPALPGSSSSARHHEHHGERTSKAKDGRRWGRKSTAAGEGRVDVGAGAMSNGSGAITPKQADTTATRIATIASTGSTGTNYPRSVKSTGPVEDVTPWEVQALPTSPPVPSKPVPHRAATVESSFSHRANANIALTRHSAPRRTSGATMTSGGAGAGAARPLVATGLAEEVTPWEVAGALPVQVERITANDTERAPLGVSVEIHVPGEEITNHAGEGQELEVPGAWGEASTPNTAHYTSSSGGHYSGSAYSPPSAASYASYVSGASTTPGAGAARPARGSMTLEQLAEVMPWELHPVPTKVGAEVEAEKARKGKRTQESQAHARQSTSGTGAGGAVAQALVEFGLRRRRSTGASGAETVAVASGSTGSIEDGRTAARSTKKGIKLSRMSTSGSGTVGGVSSSDVIQLGNIAAYPGPHPASTAALGPSSNAKFTSNQKGKARADSAQDVNDRFSTADRTILEELKASIRAREAQFKLKGVGHTVLGGGRGPGKKYHPYPKEVVPYPRAYGKDVIDLDVWETLFLMDISDSLSWHVFDTPPTKVLEIGCGTGTWILHCARTWKECHFVGLDVVPLHPDLQNVGSLDLASRITWVQHNFLEGLPFQNEEFDFVHIKRIALGVPEDRWDSFFEEVARVMKPGGRLEMIEEDLFFPGKKVDDEDDEQSTFTEDDTYLTTSRDSTSSDKRRTSFGTSRQHDIDSVTVRLEDVSEQSESNSPPTPKSRNTPLPNGAAVSRPSSPVHGGGSVNGQPVASHDAHDHLKFSGGGRHHQPSQLVFPAGREASVSSLPSSLTHDGVIPPHSRSTSRPTLPPKSKDPSPDFVYGSSSVSLLGTMGYLAYHDPLAETLKKHRKQEAMAKKYNAPMQGSQKTKPSPFLTTLMTRGPVNPRDHTILGAIWEGMLEGRFVNATPLSLLQTYLEYHFTGIRTHPPLIYTFPPTPPKVEVSDDEDEPSTTLRVSGPSESDTDDTRDAVVPRPKPKTKTRSNKSANSANSLSSNGEGGQYLSMSSLITRQSPFVGFDDARSYAYSPSKKALFRAKTGEKPITVDDIVPRMPNSTMHIDLNTLNMQLTLRAKEIVACSESMWEWVEELQLSPASDALRDGQAVPWYAGGMDLVADSDATRSIILDMTREDFDRLLCNFEWDMLDKACMGHALAERFDWHTFEGAILVDRKAYNKACLEYDEWVEEEQQKKAVADAYRHSHSQNQNQSQHHSRDSISTPGIIIPPHDASPVSDDASQITRSSSNPEASSSSVRTLEGDRNSVATLAAPSRNASGSVLGAAEAASMISSVPSQMLPQQMLSRALRVFVAWKAM